jgi:hypothetical protein
MAVKKDFTIPYTGIRLKPFISVKMATYDGTKNFTDAEILTIPLIEMGRITKFTYKNDRKGGGYYRTFKRNSPGTIDETYPGLPEYSLTLETVVFYKDTFFELLGWGAGDLGYQDKPVIIQLGQGAPGSLPERTWTYKSCWAENNPLDFEANPSDMKILQSITFSTSGLIEGQSA